MSERDNRIAREKDMRVVVRAAATLLAARCAYVSPPNEFIEVCVSDAIRLLNEAKRRMAAQTPSKESQ